METELQLLNAISQGDRTALRRLYDRYAGYATSVALRYLPDMEDVRDVMQDSFVKILTNLQHFNYQGEGSLKAWISRIVANKSIDHLKEHGRFTMTDDFPDEADTGEPDVIDIPPEILTMMIGKLPAGYRIVLNLFVFEQLSHKEIARRLNIRENSSASQFSRAKKLLAKMIKEYLNNRKI